MALGVQYPFDMGTKNQRNLFYFAAGLAMVLLIMGWDSTSSSSQKKSWLPWSTASVETQLEESSYSRVSSPKAQWKRVRLKKDKVSENTYQPTTNIVNSYTPSTEYQHPLVASTKFISKKDQKKRKAGKKKSALQAKKDDKSKSGRDFGLSDSEEDDSTTERRTPMFPPMNQNGNPAQAQNNNKKKEEEENLNSFEYWEKPIFVEEDKAMVSKLIESFQVRKVSNTVFYDLVTEMRQDERVQIRQFGLTALTSTPSVRSFSELTQMKNTDPDADLRLAANLEIANYYQEKKLTHVVSALKVTSGQAANTTYEALVVLDQATKKYSSLAPLDENSPTPPKTSGNLANIKPRFEQALSVIEQVRLTESPDAKVKAQAVQTEGSLSNFLSTSL